MRLAILTTSYPRFEEDDSAVFVKRMVEGYESQGSSGVVIVPHDKREPLHEQQGSFELLRYRYGVFRKGALAFGAGIVPNIRQNPLLILQAPLLLLVQLYIALKSRDKWDLMHANWSLSGLVACAAHLILRRPYVLTLRGEDVRLMRKPFVRFLLRIPIHRASFVTSVNQGFLEEIGERFSLPARKLLCIPNGVYVAPVSSEQLVRFSHENSLPARDRTLLFIGTVIPRKRIEHLLRLLCEEGMQEYHLFICGRTNNSDYVSQLEHQAQELGCQDRFHLRGMVSPAEIPLYLHSTKFYISASEFEGRPNSVLEAMAAGVLCLLSDIPAHQEMLESKDTAILFDPHQPDVLARTIQALSLDPERCEKYIARAKEYVSELTWERTADQYLRALSQNPGV